MNTRLILSSCLLAIALLSCRKQYKEVPSVRINISTLYPEYFTQQVAANIEVTVFNTVKGYTQKAVSGANGVAVFSNLLPGNYNITATKTLTAAEAFPLNGYNSPATLNATRPGVTLLADTDTPLRLQWGVTGDLVFKEIFYVGSQTPTGGTYFSDQFYEIFNNTADTLYADSLCIGNVGGTPGNSSTAKPYGFKTDPNNIYLQNVWMVPSDTINHKKIYPIPPGKSIIIAQDGINHRTDPLGNPTSPVNMGKGIADFESYVPRADNRDLDAPDVPNVWAVYLGSLGFDWLTSVFGASIAIFKHPNPSALPRLTEPGTTSSALYMQVPIKDVIDAVDLLANAGATSFKRIPISMDAGFKFCSGTYTGESIRRKVVSDTNGRKVLQDTNNSTQDFEVIKPPTPKNWQ